MRQKTIAKVQQHAPDESVVSNVVVSEHLPETSNLHVHLREGSKVVSSGVPERVRVVVIKLWQRRVRLMHLGKHNTYT